MITVYGRPDSSAVARVMWAIGELGLEYKRVDWGGAFGGNDEPSYRAMNPSGKIPAVDLDNGQTLWESNAIIRYLCTTDSKARFLPKNDLDRAHIEAWMDWANAFQTAVSSIRKSYKPVEVTQADIDATVAQVKPVLQILDTQLESREYVAGDNLTAADFALGVWAHRLWRCPSVAKPSDLDSLWAWIDRLQTRPAYQEHVMEKVSAGPQLVGGG